MKRIILSVFFTVCILLATTACGNGSNNADNRTISHFLQAFEDGGFEFQDQRDFLGGFATSTIFNGQERYDLSVPFFQMIGANDGIQFYIDDRPHTIYSFASVSALNQAFTDHPFIESQGWVTNGRFVIETRNPEIREFFRTIE